MDMPDLNDLLGDEELGGGCPDPQHDENPGARLSLGASKEDEFSMKKYLQLVASLETMRNAFEDLKGRYLHLQQEAAANRNALEMISQEKREKWAGGITPEPKRKNTRATPKPSTTSTETNKPDSPKPAPRAINKNDANSQDVGTSPDQDMDTAASTAGQSGQLPAPQMKKKMPAIFAPAADEKTANLAKIIDEENINAELKVRNGRTTVFPKTPAAHARLWEAAKELGVGSHTGSKEAPTFPRKWVMSGVGGMCPIEELEKDILLRTGVRVVVERMTKAGPPENRSCRSGTDLFTVLAPTSEEARSVRDLTAVYHHRVQWELPHRPEMPQCTRCQLWFHTAKYCNHKRRCVNCPFDHEPGQCQNTDRTKPAFCVNCNAEGHPANFKGCPVRRKKMELVARSREERASAAAHCAPARRPNPLISSHVRSGLSFADLARQAVPAPDIPAVAASGPFSVANIMKMIGLIDSEMNEFAKAGADLSRPENQQMFLMAILAKQRLAGL